MKESVLAQKEQASKPEFPFIIQLLETQVRFEANGDSRKAVHTIVKINDALGVQQLGRISFDYNRTFQQIEIPLVRVSHANGGTSEVLPSAITDIPNPAVEQFPAYHDVRVKAARILGLQEGDTVEYRVITTTTKHPLGPDFWLEHTFDRSGQVLEERYELDLPSSRKVELQINAATAPTSKESEGPEENGFTVYRWKRTYVAGEENAGEGSARADIRVSTLHWDSLSGRLGELLLPGSKPLEEMKSREESMKEVSRQPEVAEQVREKALALTYGSKSDLERLKAIYDYISAQVNTVDLALGATGFRARPAANILNSGYATAEDKYVLFAALAAAANLRVDAGLTGFCDKKALALPAAFKHLVVLASTKERQYWLDPAVEVAPFGMIQPTPAKCALLLRRDFLVMNSAGREWISVPAEPPFAAFQKVNVEAAISEDGQLTARVKYTLRGQNELLLRVAFHQTPKEKWEEVGRLLALSDGFRGQVTRVVAADPRETKEPFTVEYELTQLKFVDWSKRPVRIPPLLPQIGLPDLPAAQGPGKSAAKIELGTPLEVQTSMRLQLPEGTTAQTPAGMSVARDYAAYESKYSSTQNTVTASRHVHFIKREIPGDRAADYGAFVHSVQNDQGQRLILVPAEPKAVTESTKQ